MEVGALDDDRDADCNWVTVDGDVTGVTSTDGSEPMPAGAADVTGSDDADADELELC